MTHFLPSRCSGNFPLISAQLCGCRQGDSSKLGSLDRALCPGPAGRTQQCLGTSQTPRFSQADFPSHVQVTWCIKAFSGDKYSYQRLRFLLWRLLSLCSSGGLIARPLVGIFGSPRR